MSQKGLAPILIVILLATSLIGGYLIYTNYKTSVFDRTNNRTETTPQPTQSQPSPNPSDITHKSTTSTETTNWETYTDGQLTINYPPTLKVQEGKFYPLDVDISYPSLNFMAEVRMWEASKESIEEFNMLAELPQGTKLKSTHASEAYIIKVRNLTIAGYPTVEYIDDRTAKADRGTSYAHIFQLRKDGVIVKLIGWGGTKEEQQKWDSVIMRMADTIKFQEVN